MKKQLWIFYNILSSVWFS